MNQPTAASTALEQLLGRVAIGDQQAFKALYDATSRVLLAIVMRLLHDRAWSEDVLQEAYVSVWHSASNYAVTRSQPMTWLMAIARNKAIDALRSSQTERASTVRPMARFDGDESIEDPATPDPADETGGPLERLVREAEATTVGRCLKTLEAAQRQAIALAFYNGLSHSELAEHLKQPLGTVKAWVRRGLERLKRCIDAG